MKSTPLITRQSVFAFMFALILATTGSIIAWTGPTQSPPNGNVAAPLNTGATAQTKTGDLNITGASGLWATGIGSDNGYCIGASCITSWVQAGAGSWNEGGGNTYLSTGNLGIGTTSPSFPLSVNGIIYSAAGGFRFPDGTVQTTAASGSGNGALNNVVVFTSSGTWTKPAGVTKVWVVVTGGGGGGFSDVCNNGGISGGGGATAMEFLDATSISSVPVTVGAGGAPSECGDGSAGGTSSFGTYTSASGGAGGGTIYTWGYTSTIDNGAVKPTTGAINLAGGSGEGAAGGSGNGGQYAFSVPGKGGSSYWGDGGYAAGQSYGVGGGPNPGRNNGIGNGGAGAAGVVVVYEYK